MLIKWYHINTSSIHAFCLLPPNRQNAEIICFSLHLLSSPSTQHSISFLVYICPIMNPINFLQLLGSTLVHQPNVWSPNWHFICCSLFCCQVILIWPTLFNSDFFISAFRGYVGAGPVEEIRHHFSFSLHFDKTPGF